MSGEKKKNGIPEDAGIDPLWLEALITKNIDEPKEWTTREIKDLKPAEPKSKIQAYLQDWYHELLESVKDFQIHTDGTEESPAEDMFADWYDDNDIENYSYSAKLFDKFNKIAGGIHTSRVSGYGMKDEYQEVLRNIAAKCLEEPEQIEKVADIINSEYKNLATPFLSTPTAEEIEAYEYRKYSDKIYNIKRKIESNIEEFQPELKKIAAAKQTDIEELSEKLNRVIIFGPPLWEMVLYGLMSPNAPRMIINNLDYRASAHIMLAGDISTAKSKIEKIAKLIAPKMVEVDKLTEPSLEGVYKMGEGIQEGIIDQAEYGSVIIEEFDPAVAKMKLFRRIMDNETITVQKGGEVKSKYVTTQVLTACNPKDDFFIEETSFRPQLQYKEGVLSRFDLLIPLTATQLKNELLLDKLHVMTGSELEEEIDYDAIKEQLTTIAQGMRSLVKRVMITKEQEAKLKEAFRIHNEIDFRRRLLKNRPLVLMRDLETLGRLVNIITAVNFDKRKNDVDGVYYASDEDIDKAIQLWENLLQFRKQLYGGRGDRNITTVGDEIVLYIHRISDTTKDNWVKLESVKRHIVKEQGLCGRSTFYKEWKNLVNQGRIVQKGKRDAEAQLVIK